VQQTPDGQQTKHIEKSSGWNKRSIGTEMKNDFLLSDRSHSEDRWWLAPAPKDPSGEIKNPADGEKACE